jgi:hypothetical protein
MNNPLFDTSIPQDVRQAAATTVASGRSVVILEYSNDTYHAYYALGPSNELPPVVADVSHPAVSLSMGDSCSCSTSTSTGLGRPVYNYIVGRGGGWVSGDSRQEGVMEALLDLRTSRPTNSSVPDWRHSSGTYDVADSGGVL